MSRASKRCVLLLVVMALAVVACGEGSPDPGAPDANPGGSLGARRDLVDQLREAVAQKTGPSDGAGRAWLDQGDDPPRAQVGRPGRFTVVYEVGPPGIATGGMVYFQVSPFWGWSTPQVEVPKAPGFTRVEPSVDDIELDVKKPFYAHDCADFCVLPSLSHSRNRLAEADHTSGNRTRSECGSRQNGPSKSIPLRHLVNSLQSTSPVPSEQVE